MSDIDFQLDASRFQSYGLYLQYKAIYTIWDSTHKEILANLGPVLAQTYQNHINNALGQCKYSSNETLRYWLDFFCALGSKSAYFKPSYDYIEERLKTALKSAGLDAELLYLSNQLKEMIPGRMVYIANELNGMFRGTFIYDSNLKEDPVEIARQVGQDYALERSQLEPRVSTIPELPDQIEGGRRRRRRKNFRSKNS